MLLLLFFGWLWLVSLSVRAEDIWLDSIQHLLEISAQEQFRNPIRATTSARQAHLLAEMHGHHALRLDAHYRLAMLEIADGNFIQAQKRLSQGLKEAQERELPLQVSQFYAGLNYLYRSKRQQDTAITFSLAALTYLGDRLPEQRIKHLNDAGETIRAAIMGIMKLSERNALDFLHQAEHIALSLPLPPPELARTYNRLAAVFSNPEQADTAIMYAKKSVKVCDDLQAHYPDHPLLLDVKANSMNELAYLYNIKKQPEQALEYAKASLAVRQQIGDPNYIFESQLGIGRVYVEMDAYQEATASFMEALALATHDGYMRTVHLELALLHDKMNNWEQAAKHWRLSYEKLNEVSREANVKITQELSTQYQVEKKEQAILLAQAQNKQQRLQNTALLGGLGVLVLFFIVIMRNNSRRRVQNLKLKAANDQLLRLDNFKEQMIGMIAHDLKNPLNTILAYAHQEQMTPQQIASVRQSGHQLLNLVMNMLDVQKFEETSVPLQQEEVAAAILVEQAYAQVRLLQEQKGIELRVEVPSTVGVWADPQMTVRVLVNLLTNAIKYSPRNGQITMRVQEQGGDAYWEIEDQGPGIPPERQALVFERFGQLNAANYGYVGATGLGLTFCKLAVEAHGGSIGLVSEPGYGTTFYFTLPHVRQLSAVSQKLNTQRPVQAELSPKEQTYLLPYVKQLYDFQVYEVSRIEAILQQIDTKRSGVQQWREAVEHSLFVCDEVKYRELLRCVAQEA